MSSAASFFIQVGVLVSVVICALVVWWMACISFGCHDRMREHKADYRYDLNGKSYAWFRLYQVLTTLPLLIAAWLCWWLVKLLGAI